MSLITSGTQFRAAMARLHEGMERDYRTAASLPMPPRIGHFTAAREWRFAHEADEHACMARSKALVEAEIAYGRNLVLPTLAIRVKAAETKLRYSDLGLFQDRLDELSEIAESVTDYDSSEGRLAVRRLLITAHDLIMRYWRRW